MNKDRVFKIGGRTFVGKKTFPRSAKNAAIKGVTGSPFLKTIKKDADIIPSDPKEIIVNINARMIARYDPTTNFAPKRMAKIKNTRRSNVSNKNSHIADEKIMSENLEGDATTISRVPNSWSFLILCEKV